MSHSIESELLRRWNEILTKNREVLDLWRASDFRLRIGGIDITDAEIAAAEARVAHLEIMIRALEKGGGRECPEAR